MNFIMKLCFKILQVHDEKDRLSQYLQIISTGEIEFADDAIGGVIGRCFKSSLKHLTMYVKEIIIHLLST